MNASKMTRAVNRRMFGDGGSRQLPPFWFSYVTNYLHEDKHIEELQQKEANVTEVTLKETGYGELFPYYVRPGQLLSPEKFKTGSME